MALFDLQFVDEVAATDSLATELSSFFPRLADAIAVADALELEASWHVKLADAIAVSDSIAAELSQNPGEIVRELADTIEAADTLQAILTDGMVHLVTDYNPKRGRSGETITIDGQGFSSNNNSIRLDGTSCSIVSESTTRIVITQPATFNVTRGFAVLQVNNYDNNRVTEVPYWIKAPIATIEADRLPDQEPGAEEDATSYLDPDGDGTILSDPTKAEARDWERMATMVDFLLRDTLQGAGDIFARDAAGLTLLDASGEDGGQRLVADSTQDQGMRWGHAADMDFPYGRRIPGATTTAVLMIANGNNTTTTAGQADEWVAPAAGIIDAVYVYQQSNLMSTDRLDRIRILINGVSKYDSGTGLLVGHRGRAFKGNLSVPISVGDRLQVEITKTGTYGDMDCLGAARMMTT